MKYILLLCDGMADYPVNELGNETPMTVANKPHMNKLAQLGTVGLVKTVAEGLNPGSDVANLSVLGYDPKKYYGGRSPLEAVSMGVDLKETDIAIRANLVTLSNDDQYEDKTMIDYCADDISSEEAKDLILYLEEKIGSDTFRLYNGVSYRHCLIWSNGTMDVGKLTPPHDITGKPIADYLPDKYKAEKLLELQKKSYELLKEHPVNKKRIKNGKLPANSLWFWGEGIKKSLPSFTEKTGLKGAMISAVDLLKGIGILADMQVIDVDGATGYMDTNFEGKADAAIKALLEDDNDFVYLHVEAPDECGHRHEIENKVKSLEYIDKRILEKLLNTLEGQEYKIMILPDHATPLDLRSHTSDPVPFLMYKNTDQNSADVSVFDEKSAKKTNRFVKNGFELIDQFIQY